MIPDSSTSWSASPGYRAVRSANTSPTVAPAADTDAARPACGRRSVGRRTSTGTPRVYKSDLMGRDCRSAVEDHLALGDRVVADPIGAQHRVTVPQAHEHVDPLRVELGLLDVG